MKRRKVGRYYTKRVEYDTEQDPKRELSPKTFLEKHWSTETDPLRMAAEAVAWLRSQKRPDFPTADCSLSHRLRSDHGVEHDSVDDLAARCIDLVLHLQVIEGLEWAGRVGSKHWFAAGVAVELGKVHALFCIYRQLDETREKPRPARGAMWAEQGRYLSDAESKDEAWKAIPERKKEADAGANRMSGEWLVYRKGDELHAVNDLTGEEKAITRGTFFRHYLKLRKSPSE